MRFRHPLYCSVVTAIAIACGGSESTKPPPVTPPGPVVTTVILQPGVVQVEIGSSTTITADIRDQNGAVIAGRTPAWRSSDAAIATVDAGGVVRGIAFGSAIITATVEGKIGQATVTVIPLAIASVTIAAPTGPITAGQTFTLVATPKDKNGDLLPGRTVSWSSSATRVATVDVNSGVVSARSAGTSVITALSEQISGNVTIVVAAPPGTVAPSISSLSPATLAPGTTATITGANFGAGPTNNSVFVAGIQAVVTAATTTQLSVTLPASGLPCQSTQPVNVEVTTVAGTATFKHPLRVATTRTLVLGASFLETASGTPSCNELQTAGTYLISVFNAGKTIGATAGFELFGSVGSVVASQMTPAEIARSINVTAPQAARQSVVDPALAAEAHEHLARLERDMQLIRRLGSPTRYRRPAGVAASSGLSPNAPSYSLAPVPTTVGATAKINFHFNSCALARSTLVTARVVYVGPKSIVLEDNAGVLAGKIDADLVSLAKEFEETSYPLLQNFGNPLAFDDSTTANGRIIMLFTPQVNNQGPNLLGFVSACDFYRPTAGPEVGASNLAQIFYARAVTDTSAESTSLDGRQSWKRQMPSTLIHETKHIAAYAERFATPVIVNSFEATWLEEATAQMASELYGRVLHGNSWRSSAGYTGVLDCEVRPSNPSCGGAIFVMGSHFSFLTDFLQNIETKTILSGLDDNDIYGSSWLFARWLTDIYGGADEGKFLRSIVKNYNIIGVDNVTSVTGKTWPELLSQFTLMLAADRLPGIPVEFTEPSWNLPAVFAGYNRDFPSSRPLSPLTPRQATFGSSFQATVSSLKGGGAMLLKLTPSGVTSPQLLDLHNVGGGVLPSASNIGIAVLRVK